MNFVAKCNLTQGHLHLAAVSTVQEPSTFPSWPPFPSLFQFCAVSVNLL